MVSLYSITVHVMRLASPVVRQNGVDQCTRMHRIMSFRDVHADDIEKAVCSQLMA